MSRAADRAIAAIDAGLQTPQPDPTYGEVSPRNTNTCARCTRPPAPDSDWCEGCRAYLLGDGPDPTKAGRPYTHIVINPDAPAFEIRGVRFVAADSAVVLGEFSAALTRIAETIGERATFVLENEIRRFDWSPHVTVTDSRLPAIHAPWLPAQTWTRPPEPTLGPIMEPLPLCLTAAVSERLLRQERLSLVDVY